MPAITVRGVTLLPPRDTAPTNFKILVPVMANDLSLIHISEPTRRS